jgi:aryl sulfotransferase
MFEGETQGYPYWSALHHIKSWWALRDRKNLLFVHHGDLLANLQGEIARAADFLHIPLTEKRANEIAQMVSFESMKRDADLLDPGAHAIFQGGMRTFLFKGTNGRWNGVLSEEELDRYQSMVAQLPIDCVAWLENGRVSANQLVPQVHC